MLEILVSDQDLKGKGLRSISKASDILASCPLTSSHLTDEIAAVERFILRGRLDEETGSDWHAALAKTLVCTGPWYACDNGHPFTDLRAESMFQGQLRCTECGLIVADRGHASEEDATTHADADEDLPSQGEKLVDV